MNDEIEKSDEGHIQRWVKRLFPVFLFLLALIPRAEGLVARSLVWHFRAQDFMEALATKDWGATLLAPHPGVTTMWLVSSARWAGSIFNPDFARLRQVQQLKMEIVPIALVVSLLIVLAYFLLARIFDPLIAGVAALFMALDPYHLTISKTLHPDPLISTFIMISALLLILFVVDPKRRLLVFSGAFAGLALLSKTPALFLLPYFFLCLLMWQINEQLETTGSLQGHGRQWLSRLVRILPLFVLWLLPAVVTYILLWPAMWTTPLEAINTSVVRTLFHQSTPHPNPILFLGQIFLDDPGLLFYPVNMALNTTEVVLPLFILSVIFLAASRGLERKDRIVLLLMVAFVFFFVAQMSLAEKKIARYILPALQFILMMAAFAAVYLFRRLAHGRRPILYGALTAVVLAQAIIALPRHPYYGTHYNRLFGSTRQILGNNIVAGQEQSEGLDLAAAYLNNLPQAPALKVGAMTSEGFLRFFSGETTTIDDKEADYLVFSRNLLVRNLNSPQWEEQWQIYQDREPKYVVDFDGVPYVWVYKTGSVINVDEIENPITADLGSDIRLLGYKLQPQEAKPGETIELTLYWQAVNQPQGNYTVFTHLLDPAGELQTQHDSLPQNGKYPTYLWDEGEIIADPHWLTLDRDAPPGDYTIAVGMYTLETLERLTMSTADGKSVINNQLVFPGPMVISSDEGRD